MEVRETIRQAIGDAIFSGACRHAAKKDLAAAHVWQRVADQCSASATRALEKFGEEQLVVRPSPTGYRAR